MASVSGQPPRLLNRLLLRPALGAFGEVDVDTSRVVSDGVLSILYQRSSSGTTPSPVRVADLRLG